MPETGAWLFLRIRLGISGVASISYRDDAGRWSAEIDPGDRVGAGWIDLSHPDVPVRVFAPEELPSVLAERSARIVRRWDPARTLGSPLAVFVDPPPELRAASWEELVPELAGAISVQPVRLSRPTGWRLRAPFRLPFRILTVGRAREVADDLRGAHWVTGLGAEAAYGINFANAELTDLSRALAAERADIAVARIEAAPELLVAAKRLSLEQRPRILAVVADAPPLAAAAEILRPPPGVSLVLLPRQDPARALTGLVLSLVHDNSLHEAVADANAAVGGGMSAVGFVSDPAANENVRMADAAAQVAIEAATLEAGGRIGDAEQFIVRLSDQTAARVGGTLVNLEKMFAPVRELIADVHRADVDFGRERTGLKPLAEAEASLAEAFRKNEAPAGRLRALADDPVIVAALRKHQERRVDIALQRRAAPVFVERGSVLAAGSQYRLLVGIGTPFPVSILATVPPALDPLLPEPEEAQGHRLEIAVYGHDFRVRGRRVRRTYLPLLGGAEPVAFDLEAPTEPMHTARLRVAIYHRNHVVQAFQLETPVALEEGGESKDGLRATLEFSRTDRFENIDDLRPRALALGLNESRGNHQLTLKRDGRAGDVLLAEDLLKDVAEKFRKTLYEATFDDEQEPRFPLEPAVAQREEAAGVLRELANAGRSLYLSLYRRCGTTLKSALRDVIEISDETLQIIRYDPNYAFPWAALYDFEPPQDPQAEVCFGVDEAGTRCRHGKSDPVYCVYGFWGVRNNVEQLLVAPDPSRCGKPPKPISAPRGRPPVLLAAGVQDAAVAALVAELGKVERDFYADLPQGKDLLDLLWDESARPVVAVLLGHLDEETDEPRIGMPGARFVDGDQITSREMNGGVWTDPRSIVLLMACASAVSKLTTLAGLPLAFSSAGAAAVVGTEAPAFSGLVSEFARELAISLWRGASLGEAVTSSRRSLLARGNPLAFVFTAFGDADVRVQH
jgi:hypothetical protein